MPGPDTMVKRQKEVPSSDVSILIADDHDIARRGLRAILEAEPGIHVVDEAANGREAVEKAKVQTPQVVLMDIGMPEMNGVEATRRLHSDLPSAEVLILTMHFSEELLKEAVQAGALGYLLKSDADRELIEAVHAVGRHRPYFSARFRDLVASSDEHAGGGGAPSLTSREREIAQLLAEGRTNKEIAAELKVSVKTIETHRISLMRKLNLHSLSELVRYAIRKGMVLP